MRASIRILLVLTVLAVLAGETRPVPARAGLGDFLKGLGKSLSTAPLSEDKIAQGLKEALEVGVRNAVSSVSRTGGYLDNPDIRIPLPGTLRKAEPVIRGAGFGDRLDAFETSMNRAAEKAAPHAKSLFWEAIRGMTIQDARTILDGPDDAATNYLRDKTSDRLRDLFEPQVHEAMSRVDVTRKYQNLTAGIASLPLGGRLGAPDLDGYVTGQALDGLFLMLAREERKIRTDPAARVTDLLQDVFGQASSGR